MACTCQLSPTTTVLFWERALLGILGTTLRLRRKQTMSGSRLTLLTSYWEWPNLVKLSQTRKVKTRAPPSTFWTRENTKDVDICTCWCVQIREYLQSRRYKLIKICHFLFHDEILQHECFGVLSFMKLYERDSSMERTCGKEEYWRSVKIHTYGKDHGTVRKTIQSIWIDRYLSGAIDLGATHPQLENSRKDSVWSCRGYTITWNWLRSKFLKLLLATKAGGLTRDIFFAKSKVIITESFPQTTDTPDSGI